MTILRASLCAALPALAFGCASLETAYFDLDREFKQRYEQVIAELGTREFRASAEETFAALRKTVSRLDLKLRREDAELGYMWFSAPAPLPLDEDEWREVERTDLPLMQRIMARHVGLPAYLFSLNPEKREYVFNATVIPDGSRALVALTMRSRQPVDAPLRWEYPPPTAVRLGLAKIWTRLETELGVRSRAP